MIDHEGIKSTLSQASDVGSIPIARSINPDDSVDLTPLGCGIRPENSPFWRVVGGSSSQLEGKFW